MVSIHINQSFLVKIYNKFEEDKKMVKVESFSLDHTKVKAPFVRKCEVKIGEKGDIVTKFDLRFMQPNEEFMDISSIHTLEHLLAGYMREVMEGIIDIHLWAVEQAFT